MVSLSFAGNLAAHGDRFSFFSLHSVGPVIIRIVDVDVRITEMVYVLSKLSIAEQPIELRLGVVQLELVLIEIAQQVFLGLETGGPPLLAGQKRKKALDSVVDSVAGLAFVNDLQLRRWIVTVPALVQLNGNLQGIDV